MFYFELGSLFVVHRLDGDTGYGSFPLATFPGYIGGDVVIIYKYFMFGYGYDLLQFKNTFIVNNRQSGVGIHLLLPFRSNSILKA